jgi:ElaB/YqjD/DUF883 family membrane-anchored ribosome-binding protein
MPDFDEKVLIEQQMQETRHALAEKLETLENQVIGTVAEANSAVVETVDSVKEAVHETVETVKGSVQDTVDSVRDALNVSRQMDRHPWLFLGGAAALGYLGGCLMHRAEARARTTTERRGVGQAFADTGATMRPPGGNGVGDYRLHERVEESPAPAPRPRPEEDSGWLGSLTREFASEIGQLKGLAIGVGLGLVRDMIVQSSPPPLAPKLGELIDRVTAKLGGERIQGLADLFRRDEQPKGGEAYARRDTAEMARPLGAVDG